MVLRIKPFLLSCLVLLIATGCSSKKAADEQQAHSNYQDPRDPLEAVNRSIWDFNYEVLDAYVLRPVTVGYMAVVPKPARTGIANVINNLDEPTNFVNATLQAKPKSAAISLGRFVLNSSLGLFGLFDVASRLDLQNQDEDFNQTLATWGVANGPYLMLPALGSTTVRDTTGTVVDNLYFPSTWLNTPLSITKAVFSVLDAREQVMSVEQLLNDSVDPYAFIKEAYYQRKEFQIHDGNPPKKVEEDDAYLDEYLP
ncbi:VacJ family lipoprotein [Rheinheimera sediminis]|uniref:MlaA family lipoprotein n=1 Tax=Rheinheimera sp. YQF-1 TaxID=2499626 RepID=UPI000FDB7FBC|nr:VacJ family lipoprotein [Rheinheimera sp. YQF-1]RVT49200.1 VacJ family lipoprotein [Rheinheimera sp. YQF-1]